MADRSDDIKQLFSHLGLNPGDYQELRGKTRAAPRPGSSTAAPAPEALVVPAVPGSGQPAAPAPAAPEAVFARTPAAGPAAPAAAAPEPVTRVAPQPARPTVAPPPPPPSPMPGSAAPEAPQRWSLLRAVSATPPQVAQIPQSAEPVSLELPPRPAPFAPPRGPAPADVPMRLGPDLPEELMYPTPGAASVEDERPTRRLFQELQRGSAEQQRERLADVARRGLQLEPGTAPRAAQPAAPRAMPEPAPSRAAVAPAMPPRSATPPEAGSELAKTFQRLVEPERVSVQRSTRLQFNYNRQEHSHRPKQPRPENLDDVFARISGPERNR